MRIISSGNTRALAALLDRRPRRDPALLRRVARIVERVRRGGDRELLAFARRLDGLREPVEVSREEIEAGASLVAADVRRAIRLAARNIRAVARRQIPQSWSIAPVTGVTIAQRVLPLETVGCYVPGGRYPLPSSLLMTAVTARVAGVRN